MLTSIVGAALQYVERIVSFAIYMIFGPIAVAMYASKDTSSVCKTWLMGVFSEFLSIIVSLIMWISFIESAKSGDESLLHYAIMIAILGVMRNSEKIILENQVLHEYFPYYYTTEMMQKKENMNKQKCHLIPLNLNMSLEEKTFSDFL